MDKILLMEIFDLKIPFKQHFDHHSAKRYFTQSTIVRITDGNNTGYGESCPREYVSGESIQSVFRFFHLYKESIRERVTDIESLILFHKENYEVISEHPAAWCGIEVALLDLFAKQAKCSIEKLLNLPELKGTFCYSAVIGDLPVPAFQEQALNYLEMGFTDFKIKISGEQLTDYKKIAFLKTQNESTVIRLDANNCWNNSDEALDYLKNIRSDIEAIEEPLADKSLASLQQLAEKIQIPIILDESFNKPEQFEFVTGNPDEFIINVRISKMGGILNSLRVTRLAFEKGFRINIGAHVGETSILTRCALSVANAINPHFNSLEGAFGTLLLQYDIVRNPLMFGQHGELEPEGQLDKKLHGLQLEVLSGSFT